MSKIFSIHSSVLNRTVLIADETAAKTFAKMQTVNTGTPHTAEAVEVHDDATDLDALIDQTHRERIVGTMTPGEKRAFGIKPPTPVKTVVPAAADEADETHA